ncbi:hypothetical protein [Bifidobacterium sp. AGR2158]|uniref:hypothetical protein n=1 Tax=Bifidobacterium sp. AGR2158 TaxID=1280675 RepID=UPI0003FFDB6E|nr:hypothetical protein [Bifidobacterium sp. AGR2158]
MGSSMRSSRSSAAPAGRQGQEPAVGHVQKRPQLHVVENRRASSSKVGRGMQRLLDWTRTRRSPAVHIVVAVLFLGTCLLGALLLRTQMSSNSFEASTVQQHITMLQQDVEEDQTKLSQLEATLPERAQKMKMVPAQGSLSIDLNGYTPSQEGTH